MALPAPPTRRRVALKNPEICLPDLPERERRHIASLHFGYLGVAAFPQGLVWCASKKRLARLVKIRHRERFDQRHVEGRNLILMVPHFVGLELIFDQPLEPFPTEDPMADTAFMNRVIKEQLRAMPAQYFLVHRRFKTRPPGEPPVYPSRRRRRERPTDAKLIPK